MNASKENNKSSFPEQLSVVTSKFQSPIGQVLSLGLFIFVAEAVVMVILNFLKPFPLWVEILIDPVMLLIILTPYTVLVCCSPV
jgi:hypothetical protein